MSRVFIGIDNGVSGSVGIITDKRYFFFLTPTISEQDYTKRKKRVTRVDVVLLCNKLYRIVKDTVDIHVELERPMVNPTRFVATTSAMRALEATLIAIQWIGPSVVYVDSKEWQKMLLPHGIKGSSEQKRASMEIGCRMFPRVASRIRKHKDADGLLIAEHCRRIFR